MAKFSRPTSPDTLLTSKRSYSIWAATVASLAKTPRSLDRPRKDVPDLELAAAVIPEMRRELVELWEAFTLNRAEVSRYLMDPKKEALTYLLGFHLSNLARAQGMLRRAEHRLGLISWLRQQPKALHLEDLGAGTGALSFATLDLLFRDEQKIPTTVELIDKSAPFLEAAAHGLKLLSPEVNIITRRQRLDEFLSRESRKAEEASPGIVWHQLGYVWNELAHNPKTVQSLLKHLEQGLKQGSRLITLIEPANQDLSRGAMKLREELCQMGYKALYPCTHSDACPMLERTRDWCYSEWEWQQPLLMQKVDKILDIDRQRIGATAFLFASPDIAMALHGFKNKPVPNEAVVVGRPLDEKASAMNTRKFNYLLCSQEGLEKEPMDFGPERLRGVVWQKMERPVITMVGKGKVLNKPTESKHEDKKSVKKSAEYKIVDRGAEPQKAERKPAYKKADKKGDHKKSARPAGPKKTGGKPKKKVSHKGE